MKTIICNTIQHKHNSSTAAQLPDSSVNTTQNVDSDSNERDTPRCPVYWLDDQVNVENDNTSVQIKTSTNHTIN